MRIQLENWKVVSLDFNERETPLEKDGTNSFDLKMENLFPEVDNQTFAVRFILYVSDLRFELNVTAIFYFKIDEPISEKFKLSDFPKVNSPAIAFPYLRTFISNLTLNSGYDPVILPSINFVKLAKEEEN